MAKELGERKCTSTNGYAGDSWDGLVGSSTDLNDDMFSSDNDIFSADDPF